MPYPANAIEPRDGDGGPPSHARHEAGELVSGKYRLKELLGQGGMGSVWLATNTMLDAPVALKLIRSDVRIRSSAKRLLNEARAAARLRHPSIVRVFDFGQTERDEPFIVMELLSGETLADRLARERRLASTSAVQLLLPIADALITAHQQGVIHRDLKPDNVFLSEADGKLRPKVVDFGVAKFELDEGKQRLTDQGAVLGSPDYMAPEQALGEDDIDHRVDVWAFSVVLYQTVTGHSPFGEADYKTVMLRILEDAPPPISEFAAGDDDLWRIISRGLEKQPDERWPNMRELGAALAAWLVGHGVLEDVCGHSLRAAWLGVQSTRPTQETPPPVDVSSRPDSTPKRQTLRLFAGIALTAALATSSSLLWHWPHPTRETPSLTAARPGHLAASVLEIERSNAERSRLLPVRDIKAAGRTHIAEEGRAEANSSAIVHDPRVRRSSPSMRQPPSRPRVTSVPLTPEPREQDFGF